MSWLTTDAMQQKMAFVTQTQHTAKGGFAALCRSFGISRKTGYKWRARFREKGGVAALVDHSRRPQHSRRIDPAVVERIIALRQPDGWGARKIAHLLWREGRPVSVATVHRTLLRQKLVHRLDQHTPALNRFERPAPNDLFQVDFKGPMGRAGAKDEPLSVLDDHSRFAVGLFAMRDHTWERVRDCFLTVFARCGRPRQMRMDHGTPWWNCKNGWGLSSLGVFLIEQGIELIFGRVAHPQTQGKVERFHRTLRRRMIHQGWPARWEDWQGRYDEFVQRYNEVRPHEALGMKRPAERYTPRPRADQARVAPWLYSEDLALLTVDAHGSLRWEGRRYFVSEALVHRQVAAERIGGQLLVRFRHMYVREIDLEKGHTRPFIHSVAALADESVTHVLTTVSPMS